MEECVLRVAGRRLRYLRAGSGEPLLLCHGFMGSAENFETWFDALASRRTLIVPDLPGCGSSTPLPGAHTSDTLGLALEPLLDDLGLERFDLGGLCLGAAVACAIARHRPQAVGRLILHTPLLAPSLVRRRFDAQIRLMTMPGAYGTVLWLSRRRAVSDLYKRLLVEGSDVDRRAADVNFDNQCRADARAIREWLVDGLHRHDTDVVAARSEPTLILAAAGDRIVDVERLRGLLASQSHVQLAVIAAAGHGWNETYVRRQVAVLGAFLDGRPLPAESLHHAA